MPNYKEVKEQVHTTFPVTLIYVDGTNVQIRVTRLPRGIHYDNRTFVLEQSNTFYLEFSVTNVEHIPVEPIARNCSIKTKKAIVGEYIPATYTGIPNSLLQTVDPTAGIKLNY